MKINIIDPGLHSLLGHHFDWCKKIAGYLSTHNYNIKIYVHKNITANAKDALERYGEVIPLFNENPYQIANKLDPLYGYQTLYLDNSLKLAPSLKSINQDAIWIWPTLFDYQLNALALAKVKCHVSACIHTAPELKSSLGPFLWRDAAHRAKNAGIKIQFGVTFKELIPLFTPLIKQEVLTLPLLVNEKVVHLPPKSKLKRIGFFGDQRTSKGNHLLPELIKSLIELGYDITVHDSNGNINGKQTPRLTILGYVEDLTQEIVKCDLVIIPYDREVYKYMASAIAWEAIACGVPVIAPSKTVPGQFVTDENAGVTFDSFSVESIIDAVKRANLDFKTIATGAFHASENWSSRHGTNKFVEAMLQLKS
jgi:glycosyltransferase involved in cell wall biosynthesis